MPSHKASICLDCQNAYAHKCKWVRSLKPIKGWKAEKRKYKDYNGTGFTYSVVSCPGFVREVRDERKKAQQQIIELAQTTKKTLREIGAICGVSENKVLRTIKNLNRKEKCTVCGQLFTKEGNSKRCPKCRKERSKAS